jgi:hypothetical protein
MCDFMVGYIYLMVVTWHYVIDCAIYVVYKLIAGLNGCRHIGYQQGWP